MGEQTGSQSHSALRIVAACQSTGEFVAAYARYCEGRSLFIATKSPKTTGNIVKFKIALASGEHLMTGVGPVVESFPDRENRFGRPGMRVEVEKLDASGRHWMEQLRTRGAPGAAPRAASQPTGMFATVSDDGAPVAGGQPTAAPIIISEPAKVAAEPAKVAAEPAPAVVAPPVVAAAPATPPAAVPVPVPVPVADNLSAGWELDGLPADLALPPPARAKSAPMAAAAPTGGRAAEGKPAPAAPAVVASGELEMPAPLPPPPTKGRTKRITFPALMFNNKSRGLALPSPAGAGVVPKPIAPLPATRAGKPRAGTAPLARERDASEATANGTPPPALLRPAAPALLGPASPAPLAPAAEPEVPIVHDDEPAAPPLAAREPGAPVAPLGTPADTEPHVMVPPELESSIARPHPLGGASLAAGDRPPVIADAPAAAAVDSHPEIAEAPPELPELVADDDTSDDDDVVTSADTTPGGRPRARSRASTTTPPPVWAGRTVTQTLAALVGGAPDPRVVEETIHWTSPGFPRLALPVPPQVQIVEPASPPAAPAVVVGVEVAAAPIDAPLAPPRRARLWVAAALLVTGAAGLGGGYLLGARQALTIDKMPVELAAAAGAAAPAAERWVVDCAEPREEEPAMTAMAPLPAADEPVADEPAADEPAAGRDQEPAGPRRPARSAPAADGCFLNASSSPAGATVLVDGKVAGRTPLRARIGCGKHGLRFEMGGYQQVTRSVSVRGGATAKVSAELARPRTVLRVESSPSGATVVIGGASVGVTPLTTTVPGFVATTVTLSKPGYKKVSRQISPTSTSARIGVTFQRDASTRRSARR